MCHVIAERNCNLVRRCSGTIFSAWRVPLLPLEVLGQGNSLLLFFHVFQPVLHRALSLPACTVWDARKPLRMARSARLEKRTDYLQWKRNGGQPSGIHSARTQKIAQLDDGVGHALVSTPDVNGRQERESKALPIPLSNCFLRSLLL